MSPGWIVRSLFALVLTAGLTAGARAADDIPCHKSKVFVSDAFTCTHKSEQLSGVFDTYTTEGWDGDQYFNVSMFEAGFDSYVNVRTREESVSAIRKFVARANETSGWTDPVEIAGSTVLRFVWTPAGSPQREHRCFGFSTLGPPRFGGYRYSSVGFSCKRAGELPDQDIGTTLGRIAYR